MSIALSSFILLVIVQPGFFFRRFYYTNEFSKQYFKSNVTDYIFSSFLPAILIHTLFYFLVPLISSYKVDLAMISVLISGEGYESGSVVMTYGDALDQLRENIGPIFLYQLATIVVGVGGGLFIKQVIRKFKLDRKYKIFRFQNVWHYIIKGEYFDFSNNFLKLKENKVEEIEYTHIDALVSMQEGTVLYEGILTDYELSKDSSLRFIQLSKVRRRSITHDDKKKGKYYPIEGHSIVLPYANIININFTYFALKKVEENDKISYIPYKVK